MNEIRMKWEIGNDKNYDYIADEDDKNIILSTIDNEALTVHFQPLYSTKDFSVYGYESLARFTTDAAFKNMEEFFITAHKTNTISVVDMYCREMAMKRAAELGINGKDVYLFINICPATLMEPTHMSCVTDDFATIWGIPKERIILEITEESAVDNFKLFKHAIECYRKRGYKVAIDDFGAGYAGLKMLSIIEPEFVKIDRHFISNIDKALIKYNLVDSIVTICNRIGIKTVAEGIERKEELEVVLDMGVDIVQGFYLNKPAPILQDNIEGDIAHYKTDKCSFQSDDECIYNLVEHIPVLGPSDNIYTALSLFNNDENLRNIPVVEDSRILGMVNRRKFMESYLVGRYGYGFHLNANKKISQLMDNMYVAVEISMSIEDITSKVLSKISKVSCDSICVTQHGKYYGILLTESLMEAIVKRNISLARGSNPLTGLPGNDYIQQEIEKRLTKKVNFDVCYIDIDNFKPYNDHYGFGNGDRVIKTLSNIIQLAMELADDDFNFIGHIGGDDFIVITRPQSSINICNKIIDMFKEELPALHGVVDFHNGFYKSKNRKGNDEVFELLSLSIGIVSTEVHKIDTFSHLSSIAAELKKAAKQRPGNSIVRDKRLNGFNKLEKNELHCSLI
ncbi:MAG: EAL and GGDEF domain-containing protein [Candidatus Magnetoovum sp. WYHC-5]|nr:EAL and GGDEF domain-containing protein [Candidatus Magnetoovum sp. WYHC-5]